MSKVVKTETRTYTTTEGGTVTTVTETTETTASGQVRQSVHKKTESYSNSCSASQNQNIGMRKIEAQPIQNTSSAPKSGTVSKSPAGKPGNFANEGLEWHNHYRQKHGVPPLKLSPQMCAYSQEWADHLASTNSFQHRNEHKYGENIYMMGTSAQNYQMNGKEPVESWYSEIKDHRFGQEPRSTGTGHFTQVVWKTSKELGIAIAKGSGGRYYVVANYDPPGNYVGQYTPNVPPPK